MSISYQDKLDYFSLIIMSSYGIMFAILSNIDELYDFNKEYYWLKGIIAIVFGLIFYIFIGFRHL